MYLSLALSRILTSNYVSEIGFRIQVKTNAQDIGQTLRLCAFKVTSHEQQSPHSTNTSIPAKTCNPVT